MIDLATLESAIAEVFDGPGVEGQRLLNEADLHAIPVDRWGDVRLVAVPCLRLLALEHPLKNYYNAIRDREDAVTPDRGHSFLALTRREYVVQMHELSRTQFILLDALVSGNSLNQAFAILMADAEIEAADVRAWFVTWTAAGFFCRVELEAN
jgi:hypothetical protein